MANKGGEPKKEESTIKLVPLHVEREYPGDTPLYFANHFIAQGSDDEVFFSFFATTPPDVVAESPEQLREKLEHGVGAKAKCVARIVMTRKFFAKVIEALKHQEKMFVELSSAEQKSSDAKKGDDK